ncbi:hypothetical protein FJT64_013690 [Amphibalanus amphitrite]|uniref:Protein sleepless n=1 Tax=Amphibalanus amphitrite TaxID=1232801 RepID=A0A6A4V8R2_AMPAM|nr:hypothetical protein FJT64_013690 [Amphibalanus amphitrite]
MSRRPLVPLLALAALLALPPAVRGINCFKCDDTALQNLVSSSFNASIANSSLLAYTVRSGLTPCKQFNPESIELKVACGSDDHSCFKKVESDGTTVRGCATHDIKSDSCSVTSGTTDCYCTKDYCNSAGLSTPALLLLLPAALLAAPYTRQ